MKDTGNVLCEDFLSPCSGVNSNHGDSNGPRGVAYGHLEIGIVCLELKCFKVILPSKCNVKQFEFLVRSYEVKSLHYLNIFALQ